MSARKPECAGEVVVDAYVNPVDVGDPEGGWEDDEDVFGAPWEEEAWDDSGA